MEKRQAAEEMEKKRQAAEEAEKERREEVVRASLREILRPDIDFERGDPDLRHLSGIVVGKNREGRVVYRPVNEVVERWDKRQKSASGWLRTAQNQQQSLTR